MFNLLYEQTVRQVRLLDLYLLSRLYLRGLEDCDLLKSVGVIHVNEWVSSSCQNLRFVGIVSH